MNTPYITVRNSQFAADMAQLVSALTPADLPELERAYRGLSGLHAVFAQLLAPRQGPRPVGPEDLRDLVGKLAVQVEAQGELIEAMADEVAGLHKLATGMAERIAAQSEMLARRAGAASGAIPVAVAERLVDLAERQSSEHEAIPAAAVDPVPAPTPITVTSAPGLEEPSANGKRPCTVAAESRLSEQRMELARFVANGPRTVRDVKESLAFSDSMLIRVTEYDWFTLIRRRGRGNHSTVEITDVGRAALSEAGYVLVGESAPAAAETSPPEPATKAVEPATTGLIPETPPESSPPDAEAVERHQVIAIAKAIMATDEAGLTVAHIANATRLSDSDVETVLADHKRWFRKSAKHGWGLTLDGVALARGRA